MSKKIFGFATGVYLIVSPAFAAPALTIVPLGVQAGNWTWNVDITPDLGAAGGDTPINFELGFRLTGAPLLSVTNINPAEFDTSNPGTVIFGWETLYGSPAKPEGIEVNCTSCSVTNPTTFPPVGAHPTTIVPGSANEIFAALGSIDLFTPGPRTVLRIVAPGPSSGYSSSTIQWLGAFGGNGRISQIVGTNGQNFDIYSGTATQAIPEPASVLLMLVSALIGAMRIVRRRSPATVAR